MSNIAHFSPFADSSSYLIEILFGTPYSKETHEDSFMSDVILPSQKYQMSFWEILNKSIANQPPRDMSDRDVSLYPSEASALVTHGGETYTIGGCLRKAWLRNKAQRALHGKDFQSTLLDIIEEGDHDAQTLWKFKISSSTEEDIKEETERAGIYHTNSYKFNWPLSMPSGYPDGLIRGEVDITVLQAPESDIKIGIEVKSIAGYKAHNEVFGTDGRNPKMGQPKEQNLLQTVLYTHHFCLEKNEYAYFKLVYISRENGKHAEFDIDLVWEPEAEKHRVYVNGRPYWQKLYSEDILDRYRYLQQCIIEDKLPHRDFNIRYSQEVIDWLADTNQLNKTQTLDYKRDPTKVKVGDWQCRYCVFNSTCYNTNLSPKDYSSGITDAQIELSTPGDKDDTEEE